ncbi:PQQ-binding-like beta-propeller repeat protein [Deinococcus hopiensis]|nr:PQQ-binding-like beta-propeller repeat protein [Deinococcus hopiensis]
MRLEDQVSSLSGLPKFSRIPPGASMSVLPKLVLFKSVGLALALTGWPALTLTSSGFRSDALHSGTFDGPGVPALHGVKWKFKTSGPIRSTPVPYGNLVIFGSGDGFVYALRSDNGALVWKVQTGGDVASSPLVVDGTVYFTSRDGFLYAVQAQSGATQWKARYDRDSKAKDAWDYYLSSPVADSQAVYVGSSTGITPMQDGGLLAFTRNSGRLLWSQELFQGVRSSPALRGDVLYVGAWKFDFVALNAQTGKLLWSADISGGVPSSPVLGKNMVYFGSRDSNFYALDSKSGKIRWGHGNGGSWVVPSAAFANNTLYYGNSDQKMMFAMDAATGKVKWQRPLAGNIFASPALAANTVYTASFNAYATKEPGTLYALDVATGKERWHFQAGAAILSSPVIVRDTVFFGSDDGILYALH